MCTVQCKCGTVMIPLMSFTLREWYPFNKDWPDAFCCSAWLTLLLHFVNKLWQQTTEKTNSSMHSSAEVQSYAHIQRYQVFVQVWIIRHGRSHFGLVSLSNVISSPHPFTDFTPAGFPLPFFFQNQEFQIWQLAYGMIYHHMKPVTWPSIKAKTCLLGQVKNLKILNSQCTTLDQFGPVHWFSGPNCLIKLISRPSCLCTIAHAWLTNLH